MGGDREHDGIRLKKLGLTKHLFNGAAEAGAASALLYTLAANCETVKINPEWYLAEAIRRLRPGLEGFNLADSRTAKKIADKTRLKEIEQAIAKVVGI